MQEHPACAMLVKSSTCETGMKCKTRFISNNLTTANDLSDLDSSINQRTNNTSTYQGTAAKPAILQARVVTHSLDKIRDSLLGG